MSDVFQELEQLDEETLIHDPLTEEGQRELERIRVRIAHLEAELAEQAHWDYLCDFAGY